jgi:anti-sigma factor RsiW
MDDMRTPLRGLGPPGDEVRNLTDGESHPYAMWDAAYVLGSLSAADRREFETHLADCPLCPEAIAELSRVPALLSQLSPQDMAAINDSATDVATRLSTPAISPDLLPSLLASVRFRRRRARLTTWVASAAAAVVLGIGVLVGVTGFGGVFGDHQQSATTSAQPMAQVGTQLLTSTISISGQHWGTFINLKCFCLAPPDAHHDTLAMVVVGRDGSQTRLATWVAVPGHTATPAGSISTPIDQISSVQVVSADTGKILLERSL